MYGKNGRLFLVGKKMMKKKIKLSIKSKNNNCILSRCKKIKLNSFVFYIAGIKKNGIRPNFQY